MGSEFALRRRLYRMITCEVTQVEGVEALRDYVAAVVPRKYRRDNRSKDENVAAFLIDHRAEVTKIPSGVLAPEQRHFLCPASPDEFHLERLNPSLLAALVRYLVPHPPSAARPDPNNSLWRTRLKLLPTDGGALVSFIRLWRLWNKYQHNEQMNHSIPEIQSDFGAAEASVLSLAASVALAKKRLSRFKRLMAVIENESDALLLKECVARFDSIASELHESENAVDTLMRRPHGLKLLLNSRQSP